MEKARGKILFVKVIFGLIALAVPLFLLAELQNILNGSLLTYQLIMTGIGVLAGVIVFFSTFFYKENGYVKQEKQPPFLKSLGICFKNKSFIIFEIIIMEICFELIQEASIRVPSSFSTTVGIIGALILGDAAISANIVSPILIIIVAFSGICAFTIPDNTLRFAIRMFRFMYIILGYISGFLGIALGFFIHFSIPPSV